MWLSRKPLLTIFSYLFFFLYFLVAGLNYFSLKIIMNFSFKNLKDNNYKNLKFAHEEKTHLYTELTGQLRRAIELKKIFLKKLKKKKKFIEIKTVANYCSREARDETTLDMSLSSTQSGIDGTIPNINLGELYKKLKTANLKFTLSSAKYVKNLVRCIYLEEVEATFERQKVSLANQEDSRASNTDISLRDSKYFDYFPRPMILKLFCLEDIPFYKKYFFTWNTLVLLLTLVYYFYLLIEEFEVVVFGFGRVERFGNWILSDFHFAIIWIVGLSFSICGAIKVGFLKDYRYWRVENFGFLEYSSLMALHFIFTADHFLLTFRKSKLFNPKEVLTSTAFHNVNF